MTFKEKVEILDEAGISWHKIADILHSTYEEVREILDILKD